MEERLDNAKTKLNKLSRQADRTNAQTNKAQNNLRRYEAARAELGTSMTECSETKPNSHYCHQMRHKFNELTYQIQYLKKDALEEQFRDENSILQAEITKGNFDKRYAAFIASCRDSDAHYALIQDPEAYASVCSNAKNSVTCTLF
ncbi:hypothetical protein MUS1_11325 [Marinomonas ushuaiensis DSM 15871]|uniref:Uncharacterized protein n=2 Tax=Marinomonas TaxID=28253 RepID=X7E663_9GAMM|nr:hypothetical protein MUS1_11325 [Marinomonas ushuaiensis DSM 15871]